MEKLLQDREADLLQFQKVADIRKGLGESGGSELLLAQSQLLQVQADLQTVSARKQGISGLITAQSGLDLNGYVPADQEQMVMSQLSDVLQYTSYAHPGLLIEQQKVQVWDRREGEFKAALSPGFFVGYFRQRITDPTTLFQGLQGFQFGVRVPLLFGAYKASARAASAMKSGAELQASLVSRQLEAEKKQLEQELNAMLQALISYQKEVLPKHRQLKEMALTQFEQGSITYVEYVQIQTLGFGAEQSYRTMLLDAAANLTQYRLYLSEN
jgi:cobalt-zinc-cadmium resistance protein CzcA